MRRAIATASMVGTLREKLEAAAAARFEAVELSESDFIAFRGTAREARRIAEDLGVAFDLYKPSLDFEAVPAVQFEHNLERAERNLDLLESLRRADAGTNGEFVPGGARRSGARGRSTCTRSPIARRVGIFAWRSGRRRPLAGFEPTKTRGRSCSRRHMRISGFALTAFTLC